MKTVVIDEQRRIRIPARIKELSPGDTVILDFDAEEGVVTLRKVDAKRDWFEILRQCPGPFPSIERSKELPPEVKL
jgi:bifunctional DNA-binding transcriptional regulator/antitoxin component of YhaV-PrlF toxin-antitoxin module